MQKRSSISILLQDSDSESVEDDTQQLQQFAGRAASLTSIDNSHHLPASTIHPPHHHASQLSSPRPLAAHGDPTQPSALQLANRLTDSSPTANGRYITPLLPMFTH
jgi:hypothetical protein